MSFLANWRNRYRRSGGHDAGLVHVELRQSGGIAGMDVTTVLHGRQLRVTDHGQTRAERQLGRQQVGEVAGLVKELDRAAPRSRYPSAHQLFDGIEFSLTYTAGSASASILVEPGAEGPPEPFWQLVTYLDTCARP